MQHLYVNTIFDHGKIRKTVFIQANIVSLFSSEKKEKRSYPRDQPRANPLLKTETSH